MNILFQFLTFFLGLRLILNAEQYEYLDGVSQYAGLRIVVAAQGHMPFPQLHGINLAPGLATSIELRKVMPPDIILFFLNRTQNSVLIK